MCIKIKDKDIVLIAALFVKTKGWKEPLCSAAGDWLNELCMEQWQEGKLQAVEKNEANLSAKGQGLQNRVVNINWKQ